MKAKRIEHDVARNLFEIFAHTVIDSDIDYRTTAAVLPANEFEELSGMKAGSYYNFTNIHCGCVHDCCGCMCGFGLQIFHNENFITIIFTINFNY